MRPLNGGGSADSSREGDGSSIVGGSTLDDGSTATGSGRVGLSCTIGGASVVVVFGGRAAILGFPVVCSSLGQKSTMKSSSKTAPMTPTTARSCPDMTSTCQRQRLAYSALRLLLARTFWRNPCVTRLAHVAALATAFVGCERFVYNPSLRDRPRPSIAVDMGIVMEFEDRT